jgi:8-amino-7-oxononanoate synthase
MHWVFLVKEGFCQMLGLQDRVFARILTFENALGCQGAVILGSLN